MVGKISEVTDEITQNKLRDERKIISKKCSKILQKDFDKESNIIYSTLNTQKDENQSECSCKKNQKNERDIAIKALINLVKGATLKESVEEFISSDKGNLVLKSQKVVTKKLAPDLSAIKILLDKKDDDSFLSLSDEELKKEVKKLLEMLKEEFF